MSQKDAGGKAKLYGAAQEVGEQAARKAATDATTAMTIAHRRNRRINSPVRRRARGAAARRDAWTSLRRFDQPAHPAGPSSRAT